MQDYEYGYRQGIVVDPFGHQWSLATHKQDLTKEEIAESARKFFANMAKKPTPELVTA